MITSDLIKSKVHTLRTLIDYCNELKTLRNTGTPIDELEEVIRYANAQIENFKQFVKEQNESTRK